MSKPATVLQLPTDKRRAALDLFATLLELPAVERITQRGREADARFTIAFADGRVVHVGTVKTLWSQAQMAQVLGVAVGCVPPPIEAKDWRKMISALFNHAIEVDETPGETFCDTVRDWLTGYLQSASTDRDGALAARKPFHADEEYGLALTDLTVHIRRNYSAPVKEAELRVALADLGFDLRRMHYSRRGRRTTTSYYVAHEQALDNENE